MIAPSTLLTTSNGKEDKYYLIGSETFGCIINYGREEFWFVGHNSLTISKLSLRDDYLETQSPTYREVDPTFLTFLLLKHGVERPSWK